MAKRRRLSPLGLNDDPGGAATSAPRTIPPVARIAADASAQSALSDLALELQDARQNGRMIVELPLDNIETDHLTRDRMVWNPEDMEALQNSIRQRGQQTPIDVVPLESGRYGLISGARRLTALRQLSVQTADPRFSCAKAILRPAGAASEAYLAMVEENEIRSDLSFYERGRLAHEAARLGVFDSASTAVKALFVHVSASKRSKILNFVALHDAIGSALRFPEAIPEKLGLSLVKAINEDPAFRDDVLTELAMSGTDSISAERHLLDRMLAGRGKAAANLSPGHGTEISAPEGFVRIRAGRNRIVLSGKGVTPALVAELTEWLNLRPH